MDETAIHRPIRTFHPRRGRMSARHADARTSLWPAFGLTVDDGDRRPLDLAALFGRTAPVVLEIGFGMGESTAAMAAADPGRDYLGVEVHTPGIGNLLALVGESGLGNVRVAHGDAMELVHRIAPGALDAVHIFFPDPWPKARHHKRRLIRPDNVALLRDRLRPGGLLHCATDWPEYAAAMAETLDADPGLRRAGASRTGGNPPGSDQAGNNPPASPQATSNDPPTNQATSNDPSGNEATSDGDGTNPPGTGRAGRPETKFERRGARAGRPIADLRYTRTP